MRTELVYVPEEQQKAFIERLLEQVVAPGGRLIICGYGSPRSRLVVHPVRRIVRSYGFEPELEFEADAPKAVDRSSRSRLCASPEASRRHWRSQELFDLLPLDRGLATGVELT